MGDERKGLLVWFEAESRSCFQVHHLQCLLERGSQDGLQVERTADDVGNGIQGGELPGTIGNALLEHSP